MKVVHCDLSKMNMVVFHYVQSPDRIKYYDCDCVSFCAEKSYSIMIQHIHIASYSIRMSYWTIWSTWLWLNMMNPKRMVFWGPLSTTNHRHPQDRPTSCWDRLCLRHAVPRHCRAASFRTEAAERRRWRRTELQRSRVAFEIRGAAWVTWRQRGKPKGWPASRSGCKTTLKCFWCTLLNAWWSGLIPKRRRHIFIRHQL